MSILRLGLFDDHDIVQAGFRHILSACEDMAIVAYGNSGRAALQAIREHELDVCVLDLSMPDLSGMDVLRQARQVRPEVRILILSAHSEAQYGLNVLKAGAYGFFSKARSAEELISAVRRIGTGRRYISPALGDLLADGLTHTDALPLHLQLSEREFQIFSRLAEGQSVGDIAESLCLSSKTVSTYRSRLLIKLGLTSNAELVRYALINGLIS